MKSVKGVKTFNRKAGASASLKRGVNERIAQRHSPLVSRLAFTLIELLVVIAIMAVLAALIIPITGAVNRIKLRSRTRAELRQVETAIVDYKTKKGFYPPDNPLNANFINQLYYELSGTVFSNGVYTTLDGNSSLGQAAFAASAQGFGIKSTISGFMNTTKGGGDEGMAAQKFIRDLKPPQMGETVLGVKFLAGSVGWDAGHTPVPVGVPPAKVPGLNPFRYVSTNPTNNPGKFDLWIDILVQGKTNRICNWSDDAIVL